MDNAETVIDDSPSIQSAAGQFPPPSCVLSAYLSRTEPRAPAWWLRRARKKLNGLSEIRAYNMCPEPVMEGLSVVILHALIQDHALDSPGSRRGVLLDISRIGSWC